MTINKDHINKHYEGAVDEAALLASALCKTTLTDNDQEQHVDNLLDNLLHTDSNNQEHKNIKVNEMYFQIYYDKLNSIIGSLVESFTTAKYRLFDRLGIYSNGPR
jgi:c-di-AMP phosphodiesterase-like protein